MPDVFLGQVMMTGFAFAPDGFAACDGAVLSISQNPTLFALLGNAYGGDGRIAFALPDLRSRTPVGFGRSLETDWQPLPYDLGQAGGVEAVILQIEEIPGHAHAGRGSSAGGSGRNPGNALYATTASQPIYAPAGNGMVTLAAASVAAAGGGQSHANLQPYETVSFAIALAGEFPARP